MKLRMTGDSLRLRLLRAEVRQLAESGSVEERVRLSAQADFTYRLVCSAHVPELAATFSDGVMQIQVPQSLAREWCESERVTLEHVQRDGAVQLRISVEKDFADRRPKP